MKIAERIVELIRQQVGIDEIGALTGCGTTNTTVIFRQLQEKNFGKKEEFVLSICRLIKSF